MENFFPPAPCDVIVALGAFLSHNGVIDPWAVFGITIGVNLLGTIAVYGIARRFGPAFLSTVRGAGCCPGRVVWMEREYLRFGIAGIFISRLLPGFSLVRCPLPDWRISRRQDADPDLGSRHTLVRIPGLRRSPLGEEWEAINRLVSSLNRTLAIIGGLLLSDWFSGCCSAAGALGMTDCGAGSGSSARAGAGGKDQTASAGAATVLFELAQGDKQIPREDLLAIEARLRSEWSLAEPSYEQAEGADTSTLKDTAELRTLLTERYDLAARLELGGLLLRIVSSDGVISRHENRLMHRAADLLGMTPDDLAEARRRVIASSGTPETTSANSGPPRQTPST